MSKHKKKAASIALKKTVSNNHFEGITARTEVKQFSKEGKNGE